MNRSNYHSLLHLCKTLESLQRLHAQALVRGLHPHHQPLSCRILNAYAALGAPAAARKLFAEVPAPDLVSVTSLISLHLRSNQPRRALSLFSQLRAPDGFAVVGALAALARIGHAGLGKSVHGFVCRRELGSETVVGNALIDMYCKIGKFEIARRVFDGMRVRDSVTWSSLLHGCVKCVGLDSALRLFDEMPETDVVSWTVMITGHVQGKMPMQALELFRMMKSDGCRPTQITLVGVISACADIGALDLGRAIHGYVSKANIGSDLTVYNALIDMYSKSGSLDAAFAIFKESPFKDVFTYTTMISGFAVHGDGNRATELSFDMHRSGVRPNALAEIAGKEIIKREPGDDGVYALLWNMYASSCRWGEALELRKEMRNRKVFKKPGCSWIEVDGLVHEFLADDAAHCPDCTAPAPSPSTASIFRPSPAPAHHRARRAAPSPAVTSGPASGASPLTITLITVVVDPHLRIRVICGDRHDEAGPDGEVTREAVDRVRRDLEAENEVHNPRGSTGKKRKSDCQTSHWLWGRCVAVRWLWGRCVAVRDWSAGSWRTPRPPREADSPPDEFGGGPPSPETLFRPSL
ncbi:Pentatricopeptide repeat-containing protein [Ananas comosus]|uniref:Pentatricopeptide repeat-containing protein n=1 Tax=Ananas comosus TaxID=4615 RepID=A0A199W9N3_ANACO|nr:Pentatricopeptide repeat-containing protein [Ananas comosus]